MLIYQTVILLQLGAIGEVVVGNIALRISEHFLTIYSDGSLC
jgi:hypothetical protein